MKNLLLFFSCLLSFAKELNAQVPKTMPPDANDFYNNSMPLLRPQLKSLVLQTAKGMNHHKANADSLSKSLKTNFILKDINDKDIEGIVVLIMVQASKDADADLKNMVMGINYKKEKNQKNHLNAQTISEKNSSSKEEADEIQNLKLQMIMDHKSDMAGEVTYVMKKISGSQQNIINNLR